MLVPSCQALETAREVNPNLILLDVSMPGYDGGDIAHKLSMDPQLNTTRIMFFTSLMSQAEAGHRAIERAGQRFLAKPLNPKVLVDEVDRLFTETLG